MSYVDFVVWSQETTVIERIFPDEDFFKTKVQAARDFFKYGILPEIIGKWYTRAPVADLYDVVPMPAATSIHTIEEEDDLDDESRLWCYCAQPSFGQMIQCDNKKCSILWFHFECLQIRTPPKGKWYCPNCRKLSKFNKSKK